MWLFFPAGQRWSWGHKRLPWGFLLQLWQLLCEHTPDELTSFSPRRKTWTVCYFLEFSLLCVCFACIPLKGVGHKIGLVRLVLCTEVGLVGHNLQLFQAMPWLDEFWESKPALEDIVVVLWSVMIAVPIGLWLTSLGRESTSMVG